MISSFIPRPACWLCLRPGRAAVVDAQDDLFHVPGSWTLRECRACGLGWVDPGPTPEGIGRLYETYSTHETPSPAEGGLRSMILGGLRRLAFDHREPAPLVARVLALLGAAVLPWRDAAGGTVMWQRGGPPRALLDVGSGAGRFLRRMRGYGWTVAGVEPDPRAASAAADGLDVFVGAVEQSPFRPASFDVVTLEHVVEHVLDPVGTLRRCHELLRPGGVLVAVTPNLDSLGRRIFGADWRGWEVPRHVNLFSARSLKETLRRAGFVRLFGWTPSRAAAWFWRVATGRRQARAGRTAASAPARTLDAALGTIFGAVEHWLSKIAPCGEEVAVLARKEPARG